MRAGGDRVERRAGLVHQEHVGLDGDGPGDAEPLLLAAGQARAPTCLRRSLTSSHSAAPAQRRLDDLVERPRLRADDAGAVGDVVVDRLRERVGLLEHHADAAADLDRVDVGAVEVVAVVEDACPRRGRRGSRSFMRLRQRSTVVLPQPDGPMNGGDLVAADVESRRPGRPNLP